MVYALLCDGRDEKERDALDQSLYAPPGWDARAAARLNLMLRGA